MLGTITFIRRYSKVRRKGKEKEKRVIYRRGLWFSPAYPLTMYYERNTRLHAPTFSSCLCSAIALLSLSTIGILFQGLAGKNGIFSKDPVATLPEQLRSMA